LYRGKHKNTIVAKAQLRRICRSNETEWHGVDDMRVEACELRVLLQKQFLLGWKSLVGIDNLSYFLQVVDDQDDVVEAGQFLTELGSDAIQQRIDLRQDRRNLRTE